MTEPTSQEALALIAKAAQYATHPAFFHQLEAIVNSHERAERHRLWCEEFIRAMLEGDPRKAAHLHWLKKLARTGWRHYSGAAWIPDEFEDLERAGLVHCSFGAHLSRTLEMTARGREIAAAGSSERAASQQQDASGEAPTSSS